VLDQYDIAVPDPQVQWATTHPSIATVTASGLVTGLADGSANIVATFEGVAGLSELTLTGFDGQSTTFTVGGVVTGGGLQDYPTVLQNNGSDYLVVSDGDNTFTFATPLPNGSGYDVTVADQPAQDLFCTVGNGSGTISGANVTDIELECEAILQPGQRGDLVITEIMVDPTAVEDAVGEWFEIHNPTGSSFQLQGLTIMDEDLDFYTLTNPLVIPPGGYVVLGPFDDPSVNGGVPVDVTYFINMTLANDDEILIVNSDGLTIDRVAYVQGPWPVDASTAMNLHTGSLDEVSNDSPSNWCFASDHYGLGDLGTPGSPNRPCF